MDGWMDRRTDRWMDGWIDGFGNTCNMSKRGTVRDNITQKLKKPNNIHKHSW